MYTHICNILEAVAVRDTVSCRCPGTCASRPRIKAARLKLTANVNVCVQFVKEESRTSGFDPSRLLALRGEIPLHKGKPPNSSQPGNLNCSRGSEKRYDLVVLFKLLNYVV